MIPAAFAAVLFVAWVAAVRRESRKPTPPPPGDTQFILIVSPRVKALLDEGEGR